MSDSGVPGHWCRGVPPIDRCEHYQARAVLQGPPKLVDEPCGICAECAEGLVEPSRASMGERVMSDEGLARALGSQPGLSMPPMPMA
jgi:hypothetical protein